MKINFAMEKLLVFIFLIAFINVNAQYDYDNQGVIFSNNIGVSIGVNQATDLFHLRNTTSSYIRKGEIKFSPGYFGAPEGGTDLYNWIQSSYFNNSSWDLGLGGDDYNNGSPLMLIKANGKIGIGIINPNAKLDVNGEGVFRTPNSGGIAVHVRMPNETNSMTLRGYSDRGEIHLQNGRNFVLKGSQDNILLQGNDDGSIGVSTSEPKEKFHIEGNLLVDAFGMGNENGIFLRENFTASNKYNLSLLAYDHTNSGTSANGLSINAYDGISFSTGANDRNERMRIDKDGKVGIGILTPTQKLSVVGNIEAIGDDSEITALFAKTSSVKARFSANTNSHAEMSVQTNHPFLIKTNGNNERFRIEANGDTKITNLLKMGSNGAPALRYMSFGYSSTYRGILIGGTSGTSSNIAIGYDPLQNPSSQFSGYGNEIIFRNGVSFMTPESDNDGWHRNTMSFTDGSVGIGINAAPVGYKLAVLGKIITEEVKVKLEANGGWSDFVFEKDYNLPTLEEVENHINEKGHLKDIPSAADVAENGIFLGEMDAKLLQKIEELTLYQINANKLILEMKARMDTMENELENLKN